MRFRSSRRLQRLSILLGAILGIVLVTPPAVGSLPQNAEGAEPELSSRLAEGGRALARGDLDEAEHHFARARDLGPDHPLPLLGLSEVQERRGDPLAALETARRAQQKAPDHPEAVRRVARLQVRAGAPAEALDTLATLRKLRPADPEGYLLAALVLRRVERLDEAAELLRQALAAGLDRPEIPEQLAFLELGRGRIDDARTVAEAGRSKHPGHGPLALALGLALGADPDRRSEAPAVLEKALDLGLPEPGRAHLELGGLLAELAEGGCSDAAVDHLEKARELLPGAADVYFRLGNVQRACGDLDGARESLGTFQRLRRTAETEDHRGRALGAELNEVQELAARGRLEEALDLLDRLAAEGEDDRIFTLKAKILFSLDRGDEALAAAVRARELMPGKVENHYLEGLFRSRSGDLQGAREALGRADALDRERPEVVGLLAAVTAELGDPEGAVPLFERALRLKSDDPALRLAYARLLAALGRTAESERQMEVYRALGGG